MPAVFAGDGDGEQLHLRAADGIANHLVAAERRRGQNRQAEHLAVKFAHRFRALVREAAEHVDLADRRLRPITAPEVRADRCRRAALRQSLTGDEEQSHA